MNSFDKETRLDAFYDDQQPYRRNGYV
jgi:hypothetical protein